MPRGRGAVRIVRGAGGGGTLRMDRRFWSGAAIAVTVVIAGANALPALLLGSPTDAPAPLAAAPIRSPDAPPPVAALAPAPAPEVTKAEPASAAVAAAPQPAPLAPAASSPPVAAAPQPTPAAPAVSPPPVAASPAPTPAPTETASAFPPVQPPTSEPPPAAPFVAPPSARAPHAPEKGARAEQKERKARPRPVRPAIYPLREFFAWRR